MNKRKGKGISINDFVKFYNQIMKDHYFCEMGQKFSVKYIDSVIDTRDGTIWSITLRDIVTDDSVWNKIPEVWKFKDGNMVNIRIQDDMYFDNLVDLKDRIKYLFKVVK